MKRSDEGSNTLCRVRGNSPHLLEQKVRGYAQDDVLVGFWAVNVNSERSNSVRLSKSVERLKLEN